MAERVSMADCALVSGNAIPGGLRGAWAAGRFGPGVKANLTARLCRGRHQLADAQQRSA